MKRLNPFTQFKYELDGTHYYFLPQDIYEKLAREQQILLVGTRGTGKTTLLRALEWQERIENSSLRSQLRKSRATQEFIGVYIKLPTSQVSAFQYWETFQNVALAAGVFSLFLEASWLGATVRAINAMLERRLLSFDPESEHSTVSHIFHEVPKLRRRDTTQVNPPTLKNLQDSLAEVLRELQDATVFAKGPIALERLPLGSIGGLARACARPLAELCAQGGKKAEQWFFKPCFDESESVNSFQQKVINTLVRHAEWPVFFVFSYVALREDVSSTFDLGISSHPVDRDVIQLEDATDDEFKEFIQGVSTVRLRAATGSSKFRFSLNRLLGPLDINQLLREALEASNKRDAKELLEEARSLKRHVFFKHLGTKRRGVGEPPPSAALKEEVDDHEDLNELAPLEASKDGELPIYQSYLIRTLKLSLPGDELPWWERRRQESFLFRKPMISAYLSIFGELRSHPRYASGRMVLRLSDGCVRDYLLIMEEILNASGLSLKRFLGGRVDANTQNIGIRRASRQKSEFLPKRLWKAPKESARVISGLARLTAQIQAGSDDCSHLRTVERGLFVIRMSQEELEAYSDLLELIREAGESGYLRISDVEQSRLAFRVHTSLAAEYGFSYRGALYPIHRLKVSDLERLRRAASADEHARIVKELSARCASGRAEEPLFTGISQ